MRKVFLERKQKKGKRKNQEVCATGRYEKIINSTLTMFFLQGDTPTFDDSHAYEELKDYFHLNIELEEKKRECHQGSFFVYLVAMNFENENRTCEVIHCSEYDYESLAEGLVAVHSKRISCLK